VLLIAAEGADEVRLRLEAVVREKCGNMTRAPFRWYETATLLMQKGAVKTLIAMARQAEASLQEEFGLPLGLIGIDTIAACAGYSRAGDEYDNAVGQAVMNVLKAVAQELGCFVLGIDHFGKNLEAGTRARTGMAAKGGNSPSCCGWWRRPRRTRTATRSRPWSSIGCRLELPQLRRSRSSTLGRNPAGKTSARRCCG
jgi:hypothetical protein